MVNEFTVFMREQNLKRDWSNNELARRMGYTSSWISAIMTGKEKPGAKFCERLAEVYGEPVDYVLRLAKVIPEKSLPSQTKLYNEVIELTEGLAEQDLKEVIGFIRYKREGRLKLLGPPPPEKKKATIG